MSQFLGDLFWLAAASFVLVFAIGAVAFRKDFYAAYREWKDQS